MSWSVSLRSFLLTGAGALFTAMAAAIGTGPLLVAEQQMMAQMQMVLPPPAVPKEVAVVMIDDFSLEQGENGDLLGDPFLRGLGSWPWPRTTYARLLDRLAKLGVKSVAIDLLLTEPSNYGSEDDRSLAEAIRHFPKLVVLGAEMREPKSSGGAGYSLNPPLELFWQQPRAKRDVVLGLLNTPVESDGSVRQPPHRYSERLESFKLLNPPDSLGLSAFYSLTGKRQNTRSSYWHENLRYYGPPGTIRSVSAWDLLDFRRYQELQKSHTLNEKAVFIGPTAEALKDSYSTAYSGSEGMPGVEVFATEYANLMHNHGWYLFAPGPRWAVLLGLLLTLLALALNCFKRPLQRLGLGLGVVVTVVLIDSLSLLTLGLGVPILSLAIGTMLVSGIGVCDATIRLQRERLRLKRTLSRYMSSDVVDEITRNRESWEQALIGRRAEIVVLMTDIRGFTAMTYGYSAAGRERDLVDRLNQYFAAVVEELMAEGATIDKFIGDAVLAYFGAPLSRGSQADAEAAVRAARVIVTRLAELNAIWSQRGLEPWQQVVALSAGPVICGNIGSPQRLEYTVIGDAVNLATRLQGVAKTVGVPIVASAAVVERIADASDFESLGTHLMPGQDAQVVYSLNTVPSPVTHSV
jgi:adenylate cyclase